MRVGILFTLFILFLPESHALQCADVLSSEIKEELLFKHDLPDSYQKVEILRVNNDMGPQQSTTLEFKIWFDLGYDLNLEGDDLSIVGLTEKGSVFHLLRIDKRTVAKRLNGVKVFSDINVTNTGKIIGLNQKGESEVYTPSLWATPARQVAIKKWFQLFSATTAISLIGTQFYPELDMPIEVGLSFINLTLFTFNFPLYELIFTATGGVASGLAVLSKYHHLNMYPDGFVNVNIDFNDPGWFKRLKFHVNLMKDLHPDSTKLGVKLSDEHTVDME